MNEYVNRWIFDALLLSKCERERERETKEPSCMSLLLFVVLLLFQLL